MLRAEDGEGLLLTYPLYIDIHFKPNMQFVNCQTYTSYVHRGGILGQILPS